MAEAPWFEDATAFARLADLLRRVEYTQKGIDEVLGPPGLARGGLGARLHRCGAAPREVLIRLLFLGALVETEALAGAIAPMTLEQLRAARLVEVHGSTVEPLVRLSPHRGLWIAADVARRKSGSVDVAPDFVMGVARSTEMLDAYTIRRPARATLDVGTGCGYQALRAAVHSIRVLATDASPRALSFARFNALLNGLAAVETGRGDLFEPAGAQRFDLVVSNPPFVVSPRPAYIYRDSGLAGDQVIERLVRAAPAHLHEGGFCQVLCNWAHLTGADWRRRLAGWFEGSGCDAWVLRSETLDAAAYASFWISQTVGPEADRPGGLFDEWMAYYRRLGIEAVSAGLIVMRRRARADNWLRIDDEPPAFHGDCGEHVLRGFAAWDYLTSLAEPADMLGTRFLLAPDCRAAMELEPGDSAWNPAGARLRLASGMGYEGGTDPHTLRMMARCDGRRTLAELAEEMAQALDRDPAAVARATLPVARLMLERGFLVPPARG